MWLAMKVMHTCINAREMLHRLRVHMYNSPFDNWLEVIPTMLSICLKHYSQFVCQHLVIYDVPNYVLSSNSTVMFAHTGNNSQRVTHWLCFQTLVLRQSRVQRAVVCMPSGSYRISAAAELRLNFRSTSHNAPSDRRLTTGRLRHVYRGWLSTCLCPYVPMATCISAAVVCYMMSRWPGAFKETVVPASSAADWCRSTCTIRDVAADT